MRTRILTLFVSLVAVSSMASGYYNWVFFSGGSAPFTPIPAKFNLSSLPSNNSVSTVSYFISSQPPSAMVPGDTFPALISQIQAAANVWNQVQTSSLRLSFGGMEDVGAVPQTTPGIDVIFDDDMPPGLLAVTRPSLPANVGNIGSNPVVPISRSTIQLRSDLTVYQQASYYDSVFLTIAHEFGHALGLQHSLTSGLMSTAITRATTKAAPLSADDVAGISMLYPANGYLNGTGAITGTVLQGTAGVNLASVVALCASVCPSGSAISTLTNPDGTYTIGGVPPGQYYVYTHPLPPPALGEAYPDNIYPPMDPQQDAFPANTGMDTQFYSSAGGTRDWTQAGMVTVTAGGTASGVNFPNMQVRSGPAIYGVATYGYPAQLPLPEPWLISGSRLWLVFSAGGLTANSSLTPGLNVSMIGGAARTESGTLAYYAADGFVGAEVVLDTNSVAAPTPVAMALTVPNDLYVLPQALTVVGNPPPAISGATATGATDVSGDPLVTVVGANLSAATEVVFDGAPANVQSANKDGSLTVVAPPATAGYAASVEALSADGQTSQQPLGVTPARVPFTYSGPANPSMILNYGVLVPGTNSEVDIIGTNTNFVAGEVSVGFGNSDVMVERVWVLNPQRILLNVIVAPTAQPGPADLTVSSGLQLETINTGSFQVQPATNPRGIRVPVLNTLTNLEGVPAGGTAIITTMGLPQDLTGWTLSVDGVKTSLIPYGGSGVYVFQVPSGLPLGAAQVALVDPNGNLVSLVVMQIDGPPPVILGIADPNGNLITSTNPALPGEVLTVTVTGLADPTSTTAMVASNVDIAVQQTGGTVSVTQTASAILQGVQPGTTQIQFTLSPAAPFGTQGQLTVSLGTRVSAYVPVAIAP